MKLHFPHENAPSSPLLIESMVAEGELSKSFTYTLELLSDDAFIETKELMGAMMTVELERADGSSHHFNDYVTQAERTGSDGGYCLYKSVLSPWTHLLRNTVDNYIFHEKPSPIPSPTTNSAFTVRASLKPSACRVAGCPPAAPDLMEKLANCLMRQNLGTGSTKVGGFVRFVRKKI